MSQGAPPRQAVQSALAFRSAREDDLPAILALFRRVFGSERGEDRWRWQYDRSPGGPGVVTVATAGEEVVGCVGLMRQDINHLGTRLMAGQGCDAALADDYRGGGNFARMALANYAAGAEAGMNTVIAFPNHNSFTPALRDLAHERITVLKHHYHRLGVPRLDRGPVRAAARQVLRSRNRVGLAILTRRMDRALLYDAVVEMPGDLDGLLRSAHNREVLSIWKDAAYLKWRYAEHPEWRYRFHVLREAGRPIALAVVREADDTAAICELLNPNRSVRECEYLIRHIVEWYAALPAFRMVEYFGADPGFLQASLAEAGFATVAHSSLVMTGRPLRETAVAPRLLREANWSVSYGDTDII